MLDKISELFQLSVVLFLSSLLAAFIISNFFHHVIDVHIDKLEDNTTDKNAAIIFNTFFQLLVTAIAYWIIDHMIHNMQPWNDLVKAFRLKKKGITALGYSPGLYKRNMGSLAITDYGIHIVLIIILVEMNASLMHNLHQVQKIMAVSKPH